MTMNLLDKIDRTKLPQHVAFIMDGNGRWAKKLGQIRLFGHKRGVKTVKEMAGKFDVSLEAMKHRLEQLGYSVKKAE